MPNRKRFDPELLTELISSLTNYWDKGRNEESQIHKSYSYLSEVRGIRNPHHFFKGIHHPFFYDEVVSGWVNAHKQFNDPFWYDQYKGYLFLPITDQTTNQLTGYDLRRGEESDPKAPRYLKLKLTNGMIFNYTESDSPSKVIVCEAVIDAMSAHLLYQEAYGNTDNLCVSSPLRAVMDENLIAYYTSLYDEIIFLYDSDDRGEACRDKVSDVLAKATGSHILDKVSIKTPIAPIYKDVNDYWLKQNPAIRPIMSKQFL